MNVSERKAKSIITKSNLPSADFVINPYIGCQHACKYCYADFMKRFTNHSNEEWGSFVDVKSNSAELIGKTKIKKNSVLLIGSVTDPYQQLEGKFKSTQKCLKKLLVVQPQLEVLTKSPLIIRDIDLLKKFKNLRVGISIGVLNEKYARQLEPFVATPKKRLETLKKLHKEGIYVYLFVSPIFPKISDVGKLIELSKDFVDEIFFENLNIRANNRKRILGFIKKNKPGLKELYEGLSKNKTYWNKIEKQIREKCKKEGVKYKIFFHHSGK